MADPLSITTAILGITATVFKSGKTLHDLISSYKELPRNIRDLRDDLKSLCDVLTRVQTYAEHHASDSRIESLRGPLQSSLTICSDLNESWNECMKTSKTGEHSFRAWMRMKWRDKTFNDMKNRLESYRSVLSLSFASISLQHQDETEEGLESLRRSVEEAEADLSEQLTDVHEALEKALKEQDQLLQTRLREERTRLENSLKSLKESQNVFQKMRPRTSVVGNQLGPGARALFGSDLSPASAFDLTASRNILGTGALMGAGAFSPATLQALLRQSETQGSTVLVEQLRTEPALSSQAQFQSAIRRVASQSIETYPSSSTVESLLSRIRPGRESTVVSGQNTDFSLNNLTKERAIELSDVRANNPVMATDAEGDDTVLDVL